MLDYNIVNDTSYEELPDEIKEKLVNESVYYSKNYCDYVKSRKEIPIFFWNDIYIVLVVLKTKMLFSIAHLPVEYVTLRDGINDNAVDFLDRVLVHLKEKYKIAWLGPSMSTAVFSVTPTKCIKIPFGSYVLDLRKTEEELWEGIHSKHRNVIRRAIKDKVTIQKGGEELLKVYMPMENKTWERSYKKSNGYDFYQNMFANMPTQMKLYIAYKEDEPQGGAIFFYNLYQCYYLYAASIDKPSTGAMNYLHWVAILDMKNLGVEKYNFVGCRINADSGSKVEGIQRFKERFGGELVKGYMFKVIENKLVYNLYKAYIYFKKNGGKKFPIDTIEQEYYKWK